MTQQTVTINPTNGSHGYVTTIAGALTPTVARSLTTYGDVKGTDANGDTVIYHVRKTVRKSYVQDQPMPQPISFDDDAYIAQMEAEALKNAEMLAEMYAE